MSGEYQPFAGVLRDVGAALRACDDHEIEGMLVAFESAANHAAAVDSPGLERLWLRLHRLAEVDRLRRRDEAARLDRDYGRQPDYPDDGWGPPEFKNDGA
jgi:hypothetical protein